MAITLGTGVTGGAMRAKDGTTWDTMAQVWEQNDLIDARDAAHAAGSTGFYSKSGELWYSQAQADAQDKLSTAPVAAMPSAQASAESARAIGGAYPARTTDWLASNPSFGQPATFKPITGLISSLVTGGESSVGGSTPTMTPTGYSASTYSPTDRTVDASKETVAGQFSDLTRSSNPLMQMARTGAAQQMNDRGLINSSMAIGASDAAAYQAALPIAQADASTYSQASRDKQSYDTQAAQFDATAKSDASKFYAQALNDAAKTSLALQEDMDKAKLTTDTQRAISSSDAAKGVSMQLQQNVQMLQSTYATKLAEIMHDTTMSAEGKTAAKAQLDQWYNTSVSQQGSIAGVDVDSILVGV